MQGASHSSPYVLSGFLKWAHLLNLECMTPTYDIQELEYESEDDFSILCGM